MPKRVEFACGAAALPRTLTWRKSGWHVGKPHHVGGCRCSVTFCRPAIRRLVPWRETVSQAHARRGGASWKGRDVEGRRCAGSSSRARMRAVVCFRPTAARGVPWAAWAVIRSRIPTPGVQERAGENRAVVLGACSGESRGLALLAPGR